MPRLPALLLLVPLAFAGCYSTCDLACLMGVEDDLSVEEREEARRGWEHAQEGGWPVQTMPTLDRALRIGMPAEEVRRRLGEPDTVDAAVSEWTYREEGARPLVVRLREGAVARWFRARR